MKKKMGRPAGDAAGLGGSAVLADGQDRRRPSAAGGKSGQLFAVLLVHGSLRNGEVELALQTVRRSGIFKEALIKSPHTASRHKFPLDCVRKS